MLVKSTEHLERTTVSSGHGLDPPSHDARTGPARQEMLRVLCLFRQCEPKLCAADVFFTSLRTTKDLMYVMVLPMPRPAVPIGRLEALSGGRCPRGAEKCRTMRPVLLAIRPQAAGTVGCDCEILWARPRRLTLGLQRLHCNVLLWDVPGCRNRTLAPARKQEGKRLPLLASWAGRASLDI